MKITDISIQAKNPDRVNISVDGKYRFSLDVFQVGELGIKRETDYTEEQIHEFETESEFGKLYARTLEYTMIRPHSAKEIRDYLWRKTRPSKYKTRATGEIKDRPGVSTAIADRVYDRLLQKGYIDDEKFTRYWLENRRLSKGASQRALVAELRAKGVTQTTIDGQLMVSGRDDELELAKMIAKKRVKYQDDARLIHYLMRQGFQYDDVRRAIEIYQTDQLEDGSAETD